MYINAPRNYDSNTYYLTVKKACLKKLDAYCRLAFTNEVSESVDRMFLYFSASLKKKTLSNEKFL